jgi:hypothetical protein
MFAGFFDRWSFYLTIHLFGVSIMWSKSWLWQELFMHLKITCYTRFKSTHLSIFTLVMD